MIAQYVVFTVTLTNRIRLIERRTRAYGRLNSEPTVAVLFGHRAYELLSPFTMFTTVGVVAASGLALSARVALR
jgi:hypothetical protein